MSQTAILPHAAAPTTQQPRAIATWLLIVAAMIVVMIGLGAVTRLTESGLSMVEWRPVTGWLPPLDEAAWLAEFAKYQQSPEYRLVNHGMTLDGFKSIFWLEYLHRLLGRVIGLAFALPLAWFVVRRAVPPRLLPHLLAMLVLGGAQGAVGWLMVASGLVDRPSVSHYRLAAHLGMAVLIYLYVLWMALRLLGPWPLAAARPAAPAWPVGALMLLVGLVMVTGAFVAGLDAGLVHNTFPTMSGYWLPPGLYELAPGWLNHFENITMIQFQHRWLAKATGVAVVATMLWLVRRPGLPDAARAWAIAAAAMVLVQIALGVATLLLHVPVFIATLHQLGAVALLTLLLVLLHRLRHG